MTSKISKIGLIMSLMGIGTLAVYSVDMFIQVDSEGIILFDLIVSVLLTMYLEIIMKREYSANFSN